MLGEVPNCLRSVVVSILLLHQEGSSIKLEKELGSAFRDSQTTLDGRNLCLAFITKYYSSLFAKDIFQIKPCEGRNSWKLSHSLYSMLIAVDWERKFVSSKLPSVSKDKMDNIRELDAAQCLFGT